MLNASDQISYVLAEARGTTRVNFGFPAGTIVFSGIKSSLRVTLGYNLSLCQVLAIFVK